MSSLNSLPSTNKVAGRLRFSRVFLNLFTGVAHATIASDVIGQLYVTWNPIHVQTCH